MNPANIVLTRSASSYPSGRPIVSGPALQKLRKRYARLLARYRTSRVDVSLSELAEVMICTPRYARSLLQQMQAVKWLAWQSRPGRGAVGQLQCSLDEASLLTQNEVVSLPAVCWQLPDCESGFVASPLSVAGYRYVVRFYRPLTTVSPDSHATRAERHVLQMVHAGLTRWKPGEASPGPGLAHAFGPSVDRLSWHFQLRPGLVWHSGEPVRPEQLLHVLRRLLQTPRLPSVREVSLHGRTLTLHLHAPDALLAWRLAEPTCALAHPEVPSCGLGPFRVQAYTPTQLTLVRAPGWYGGPALAAEVVYDTTLHQPEHWATVRVETSSPALLPKPCKYYTADDAFTFLTFRQEQGCLDEGQQALIRQIAQSLAGEQMLGPDSGAVRPLTDWLQTPPEPPAQAFLPQSLNLVCFRVPELVWLAERLAKSLRYRGCRVQLTTISAEHWLYAQTSMMQAQDICLGYMQVSQDAWFGLEQHWRHSTMLPAFFGRDAWIRGELFLNHSASRSPAVYHRWIRRVWQRLLAQHQVTPLYGLRSMLAVPETVQEVHCYPQAWPDFTRLWTEEL